MFRYFLFMIGLLALTVFLSCGAKSTDSESGFWVEILNQDGDPVKGAHIEIRPLSNGDFDHRETNGLGLANCPDQFKGNPVCIFKNNYYTRLENDFGTGTYILTETPWFLTEIGEVEGFAINMDGDYITTASVDDKYRTYSYDDNGVTELARGEFPVRDLIGGMVFKFYDNLLWYTSGGDGIYIYDLTDPLNPVQVAHHEIEGVVQSIAKRDRLLAVCSRQLHFFNVHSPDNIEEIQVMEFEGTKCMEFIDDCLVMHSREGITTVLNVQDPDNIVEIYSGAIYEYSNGFFHGDTLVLVQMPDIGGYNPGIKDHYMVTFDDPANPEVAYHLLCDDYISGFVNDTLAFCSYPMINFTSGLLRRSPREEFEVAAVLSENSGPAYAHLPYFVIDEKVWILR